MRNLIIIHRECVCMFVRYATPPRRFASRAPHFQGFMYDPTFGSSQFYFFEIDPLLPFLRTIEVPFVVTTQDCPQRYVNNYVQLLIASGAFSSIVRSCDNFKKPSIYDSTMYQDIGGYLCDGDPHPDPDILQSRTNYQDITFGG